MKELAARMDKIPPTMVIQKYVYGADTIFATMAGSLEKIRWENGLE